MEEYDVAKNVWKGIENFVPFFFEKQKNFDWKPLFSSSTIDSFVMSEAAWLSD